MIDVLIGGIAKNTEAIEKLTKRINLKLILIGVGLMAIAKVVQDQNKRIDAIEEELSELNTEGEQSMLDFLMFEKHFVNKTGKM